MSKPTQLSFHNFFWLDKDNELTNIRVYNEMTNSEYDIDIDIESIYNSNDDWQNKNVKMNIFRSSDNIHKI